MLRRAGWLVSGWFLRAIFWRGLLTFVARVWLRALICPHCGTTYSGGLITVLDRFSFLRKGYGCDWGKRRLAAWEKPGYGEARSDQAKRIFASIP
jgi:hypothetical protein